MHYFLDTAFDPSLGVLNAEESGHAIKALRIKAGDEIEIGNGRGERFHCAVSVVGKREVQVAVLSAKRAEADRVQCSIALAPTKNASRFEWFLEKATEMGMDKLIPLQSSRTEHPRVNAARMERICHAASKQSQRSFLPKLQALLPFTEVTKRPAALKLIAHCVHERPRMDLSKVLHETSAESVLVLIGPEGDFSLEEIEAAVGAGFTEVSLGSQRLRTETAGVYCAALLASICKCKA